MATAGPSHTYRGELRCFSKDLCIGLSGADVWRDSEWQTICTVSQVLIE